MNEANKLFQNTITEENKKAELELKDMLIREFHDLGYVIFDKINKYWAGNGERVIHEILALLTKDCWNKKIFGVLQDINREVKKMLESTNRGNFGRIFCFITWNHPIQ